MDKIRVSDWGTAYATCHSRELCLLVILFSSTSFFFSKHISGLHTAYWPRDAILSETAKALMLTVISPPARQLAGTNFTAWLTGDTSVSSLSRAISQKVSSLGNRAGDPTIPGPSLNHTTTDPLLKHNNHSVKHKLHAG